MIIYFLSRRWVFWCCWGNLVFFCTGGLIIISISGIRNVKAKGKIQKSRVRDKKREGPRTCPSGPDRLTYCLVKREREKEKDSNSRNVLSHVLRENRIFKQKNMWPNRAAIYRTIRFGHSLTRNYRRFLSLCVKNILETDQILKIKK